MGLLYLLPHLFFWGGGGLGFPVINSVAGTWAIIKVLGHQHRWLAGGYDLEIGHFLEVASMVVTWLIVALLPITTSNRWMLLYQQ